nr:hypothetical protein [uncultured Holophaga sp.]
MGRVPGHGKGCFLRGSLLILGLVGIACHREDPRIRELTTQASQSDEAAQQLRRAWMAQLTRLPALARHLPHQTAPLTIPFTPEQIRFLQARINAERDVSSRALIQEALVQDELIRKLGGRLEELKKALPAPDEVQPDDSHYGLAMRFLRAKGIPDDRARRMLSRIALLDRLAPGFLVYHFMVGDTYATWVAQGSASCTPAELNQPGGLDRLKSARDRTLVHGGQLSQELRGLQAQKRALELEVSELQLQRESFSEAQESLQSEKSANNRELNSLHYLMGRKDTLEREGIISMPLLGRSQAGPNWRDALFTRHLDLRRTRTLQLRASDLGLPRIGRVEVVPGSYLEKVHYRILFSPDRQSATVELLVPARFMNDKVVFAVSR